MTHFFKKSSKKEVKREKKLSFLPLEERIVLTASILADGLTISATEGSAFSSQLLTEFRAVGFVSGDGISVSWGDGSKSIITTGNGGFTIPNDLTLIDLGLAPNTTNGSHIYDLKGVHSYVDEGSKNITVDINTSFSALASAHDTANVADASLTISSGTPSYSGLTLSNFTATFHDNNTLAPLSNYSATMDWGDGTTSVGTIVADDTGTGNYHISFGNHSFTDYGTYDGIITINDVGAPGKVLQVSLTPPSPLVVTGGDITRTANEGTTLTFTDQTFGTFTTTGDVANESAGIIWGDGASSRAQIVDNEIIFSGSHTYADNGNYVPQVVVNDSVLNVHIVADAGHITINNVAPIVDVFNADSVLVNSTFALELGRVTDPGNDTVTKYVVDWGDGSSNNYDSNGDKTHIYTTSGDYQVKIALVDEDGTFTQSYSPTIHVLAVSPDLSAVTIANGTDGQLISRTLATFTDPSVTPSTVVTSESISINWGDGSQLSSGQIVDAGNGTYNIVGNHTYADEKTYVIAITITNNDTHLTDTLNTSIVIDNAPLTQLGGATIHPIKGQIFTNATVATFHDANLLEPASDFTANISWGDGISSTGIIQSLGNGDFKVLGTHTYNDSLRSHDISVKIFDDGVLAKTIDSTAQNFQLWGINDKGMLFSIANYLDPINTTTDYGPVVYRGTNGSLIAINEVHSFAVDSTTGMAYLAAAGSKTPYTGLPSQFLSGSVLLSFDLDNIVKGQPNLAKVVGYINSSSPGQLTALTIAPSNAPNPGALYALLAGSGSNTVEKLAIVDVNSVQNGLINVRTLGAVQNTTLGLSVTNKNGDAMDFDGQGRLFISNDLTSTTYQISPTNGSIIGVVGREARSGNVDISALAWDSTNNVMLEFESVNDKLGTLSLQSPGGTSTFAAMLKKSVSVLNNVVGMEFYF